ncbi:nucleoside kinase [Anaerolentibacter hominis]|uniref:nucleoside kinase n=1 Tax=Anaerolentibacter hominis TaxID=3079009 RepID=UPI0031B7ED24
MSELVTVTILEEERTYEAGTLFSEIAKEYADRFKYDIILVNLNNKLYEMNKKLERSGTLSFITIADSPGHKTYVRGAVMMFLRAIYAVMGEHQLRKVKLEYSVGDGYYFDYDCDTKIDEATLQKVEAKMHKYVEQDIPFEKVSMDTDDVRELFLRHGMYDKDKLFRYRRVSRTNIYRLGAYEDYFYGYMPPSTGMVREFSLHLYEDGIILVLPGNENPSAPGNFYVSRKLFQTQHASNLWGEKMGLGTVGELNDAICKGGISHIILTQEAYQERLIGEIAEQIAADHKRIIMIAGPSSSGKTTFSHRLSIQLDNCGMKAHPIAIDNYFVEREKTPRDKNGDYNFECLEALDIEQFNRNMMDLLSGRAVDMPTFNFKLGRQEFHGNTLQLGPDEVLVIEGIHGLNNKLTYNIPKEDKFKIYISALTQMNVDEHNRIPTTDTRLLRRIVRDARTRGSSAAATIARWPSVRRGEEEYIFPFQEEADVMFNSAMTYELAVLKQFAEPLLFGIERECAEYVEAKRLLKFLEYFLGISSEEVPHNSLLREFVGGSVFHV